MHRAAANHYSLEDASVYPHIKITRERFPRFLATRRIVDDGSEYFGAFLPKTGVRILMDVINRVFRLRSCDIEIDGNFTVPCVQHFRNRCAAPCVQAICSEAEHAERTDLLRTFLKNDRARLVSDLHSRIDSHSQEERFEKAAELRNILLSIENFWSEPRWDVWLDNSVDHYDIQNGKNGNEILLITRRGRRIVGRHLFRDCPTADPRSALSDVLRQFYRFHSPREIRISVDIPDRRLAAMEISERFGRSVPIRIESKKGRSKTASRAMSLLAFDNELELTGLRNRGNVQLQLKSIFCLDKLPRRIEAIDVAHTAGTGFTAAAAVWENGELRTRENDFEFFSEPSELLTLAAFTQKRYKKYGGTDLVLIDGGMSHLKAALNALNRLGGEQPAVVAAVKPRGRHSQISHFLLANGQRIPFDQNVAAMGLLLILRDESHSTANQAHRDVRDSELFYARSGVRPLVVPIRFTADSGDADDLRLIDVSNRRDRVKRT